MAKKRIKKTAKKSTKKPAKKPAKKKMRSSKAPGGGDSQPKPGRRSGAELGTESSEQPAKKPLAKAEAESSETAEDDVREQVTLPDLQNKLLHVRVGSPHWTPSQLANEDTQNLLQQEIEKVERQLSGIIQEHDINCLVYVTHAFVDIDVIVPRRKG